MVVSMPAPPTPSTSWLPAPAAALTYFGKTITRQVDDIPFGFGCFTCTIRRNDLKVVNELCFSRRGGCFGQFIIVAKHVDQRGFTHVAPADKCILRPVGFGAFVKGGTADQVLGRFDDHGAKIQEAGYRIQDTGFQMPDTRTVKAASCLTFLYPA